MKSFISLIAIVIAFNLTGQIPGQVVDTVFCEKDKNQMYSVYLPSSYTEDKKWPIIYFFEPAARGALPVRLYSDVAEELGYILVCTYNSRNGSFDNSFKAADALFLDTENRFSIDFDKIILSGFSGGSRLALSIAVISKAAYGVIGVGAAQPPVPAYMVLNKQNFKYVGLVGSRDMNYLEHKTFRSQLDAFEMDNLLVISNFTHRWADPEDFRIALLWMNEDSKMLQEAITNKIESQMDSIPLSDIIALDELIINQEFISSNSKHAKKALKEESKYIKKEELLKKTISDSINSAFESRSLDSPSLNWVTRRIERLKAQKAKSESLQEKMMIDRLLNYTSAACYETGLGMKTQGFTKKALVGFAIWEAVTENPVFAHWLKARVYAVEKDTALALSHLEAAIKSGNVRKQAVFREPDFKGLHEDPRFKQLINNYYD